MSKKDKQIKKLLRQKTLSSKEAVRLLELSGWVAQKNSGSSHLQLENSNKDGKATIPLKRKTLDIKTKKSILKQSKL